MCSFDRHFVGVGLNLLNYKFNLLFILSFNLLTVIHKMFDFYQLNVAFSLRLIITFSAISIEKSIAIPQITGREHAAEYQMLFF